MVSVTFLFAAASALLPFVSAILPRQSPEYGHDFEFPLPIPPIKEPLTSHTDYKTGTKIDFYEVKIREFKKRLFPDLGEATLVGYDGMAPGPTFRIKKGTESVVRFVNEYGRKSAVHLHGSYSRAPFDGWAEDTIEPGQYKDYYYPNKQDGRTLWYHDHAMGITALNVYSGQAGFYIIEDPEMEAKLDLPQGKYDIPLMFQSHFYDASGAITDMTGERNSTFGDTFSVNGQILPYLDVEPRKYRFRFLNAAASRTFNFTLVEKDWEGPLPMYVVGSDSGFTSHPVETLSLVQAMAERWEVIIDFSNYRDKELTLKSSRTFADEDYEGTGNVLQFRVGRRVTSKQGNGPLPPKLIDLQLPTDHEKIDQRWNFTRTGVAPNFTWLINNVGFSDVYNRVLRNVPRGTIEKWILHGGGGWSHPIHIHLVDFQIVSRTAVEPRRNGTAPGRSGVTPYEAAALKDVSAVGQNEEVTVLAKYAPWAGTYMFHCHNLIHEDHEMMAAFNVTRLPEWGYPESMGLLDPMDPKFRAKEYRGTAVRTLRDEVLPMFAELRAYGNVEEVMRELDEYHATRTPALTGSAWPTLPPPPPPPTATPTPTPA
ncbi:Cupredoxin [Sphaerosporella brunnea]|uniref:Cupredoxin n=1 Tax=Sphaerosporella brunnea TaxID=1250544 RepID=A0A5J5FBH0_9PEZI|nr:Cupredoxin [Sphaerosporella brunnea]